MAPSYIPSSMPPASVGIPFHNSHSLDGPPFSLSSVSQFPSLARSEEFLHGASWTPSKSLLTDESRSHFGVGMLPDTSVMADASSSQTPKSQRMSRLIQEYKKGNGDLEDAKESTAQGALMLSLHMVLEDKDIEDRGEERIAGVSRFALEGSMMRWVDRVVYELQYFLQRSSAMVSRRDKYFRVDPEDAIIPTLKGCGDRSQLIVIWEILRKRLELGQEFFRKYVKEFRKPEAIEDFSPASTTRELVEELS